MRVLDRQFRFSKHVMKAEWYIIISYVISLHFAKFVVLILMQSFGSSVDLHSVVTNLRELR